MVKKIAQDKALTLALAETLREHWQVLAGDKLCGMFKPFEVMQESERAKLTQELEDEAIKRCEKIDNDEKRIARVKQIVQEKIEEAKLVRITPEGRQQVNEFMLSQLLERFRQASYFNAGTDTAPTLRLFSPETRFSFDNGELEARQRAEAEFQRNLSIPLADKIEMADLQARRDALSPPIETLAAKVHRRPQKLITGMDAILLLGREGINKVLDTPKITIGEWARYIQEERNEETVRERALQAKEAKNARYFQELLGPVLRGGRFIKLRRDTIRMENDIVSVENDIVSVEKILDEEGKVQGLNFSFSSKMDKAPFREQFTEWARAHADVCDDGGELSRCLDSGGESFVHSYTRMIAQSMENSATLEVKVEDGGDAIVVAPKSRAHKAADDFALLQRALTLMPPPPRRAV